jgi:type IV pilus assembly protein PilA
VLATLKARRDREEGFTLIELMVVVLIIAILIAIAIPTFLGARQRAEDRAAQSSARNALTAAKTIFTDSQSYTPATPAALLGVEPSLTFPAVGTGSSGQNDIATATPTTNVAGDTFMIAVLSKANTCWYMKDVSTSPGAGTFYGTGAPTAGKCPVPAVGAVALSSW